MKRIAMDSSQIRYLVIFMGNPRSGTTLVRSLLNAHPNALIANEADILQLVEEGLSRNKILKILHINEVNFANNPTWTNYNYKIDFAVPHEPTLQVIGDKKAARTIRAVSENWQLYEQLVDIFFPIVPRIIHCIRSPLDCIATRVMRSGKSPQSAANLYFEIEHMLVDVKDKLGASSLHHIYMDQLIYSPQQIISKLLMFLDLEIPVNYITACQSLIYKTPRQTRSSIDWPLSLKRNIMHQLQQLLHLRPYSEEIQQYLLP